ncbi:LysE family translocator [Microbacterium terricola]|uniref:Lysine transporter LysE n=1 Tax=Microbacterium terricola TaxID=344163 RepID=A0ABM8E2U8_9MICO|nr:LysE family translocator [Microbacterium terricola]UYK40198.1 LysE family translocator [Microbacterium terricola]BDV32096.1 lysine transporter LysE [Microbacterium terricola]
MVPLDNLLAFALASLVIIVIPGPAVLFSVGRTLALGRAGGLLSVVGVTLSLFPIVALVAIGVGGIVAQSVVLFTVLKVAGALYLAFLGVQAIRHRKSAAAAAIDPASLPRSHGRQLWQGFIVGVTNPKTIAFFVAVLPQFVDLSAGSVPLQMMELGLVFGLIGVISDSAWVLLAAAARAWFAKSPKRIETLTATGGGMMVGLGGILLVTGGHQ